MGEFAAYGWCGVDLFFVLSGFLIGRQVFEKISQNKVFSFRDFYIRRWFRIIPNYIVVLAVIFCFPSLQGDGMPRLWRYLTFSINLGGDYSSEQGFGVAWSLCIEEQFYLLFPIFLIFKDKLKGRKGAISSIVGLFLVGILARTYAWFHFLKPVIAQGANPWDIEVKQIYVPTYTHFDGILVGITIAAAYIFEPNIRKKIESSGNLLLFIGLLGVTVSYVIDNFSTEFTFGSEVFGYTLLSLGFGAILLSALCKNCFLFKRSVPGANLFAKLSYAVYLSHVEVLKRSNVVRFAWTKTVSASSSHFRSSFSNYNRDGTLSSYRAPKHEIERQMFSCSKATNRLKLIRQWRQGFVYPILSNVSLNRLEEWGYVYVVL